MGTGNHFARLHLWRWAGIVLPFLASIAEAQQVGDAAAGKRLADVACVSCHVPSVPAKQAPDFASIAAMSSTTALSLGVFMRTSHPTMPNVLLTPSELDDVISYILSLRR